MLSAICFNLDQSKILPGKVLTKVCKAWIEMHSSIEFKLVLEATCIRRPPALIDPCSYTTNFPKST